MSWGDRGAVIATKTLASWMGYVWEVEEDNYSADKKGDETKKSKKKREKKFSADRMERTIMWGSLYKDISNIDNDDNNNDDEKNDKDKDN